jgi:hypothetical protein
VGLLKKGLLIYEDENLQMMNRSFNNFVLETIKEEEALAMEKEERSKGKWSNVSAVLLIIVMGLVVLIALGQPGFFSNINAIMAAIVGVTGILIKVDGFFSIGKKLGG